MQYRKPNLLCYRIAQMASWLVATFVFRRRIIRNEIKRQKGPFVVIANHQAALDFVNLIGLTARPMTFVISKSFYSTLPIKGFLQKMGVIPKQQFQTTVADMKKMKAVVDAGQPLVIYPAGLMCEDGLSTPIPNATYKFLKWLNVDIYVAKTCGTYFAMPKWGKGMRPVKTFIDVYKIFSKEELESIDLSTLQQKTEQALIFDAYREQEQLQVKYAGNRNIEGLEHVLYQCPACEQEFSMAVCHKDTIFCSNCGFAQRSDEYGFLHKLDGPGEEIRYVSDWSRLIQRNLAKKILSGEMQSLRAKICIQMIDPDKNAFQQVGTGELELQRGQFLLRGTLNGEEISLEISTFSTPTLPFSPGRYLEVQQGGTIYRCVPENGELVMKFIHMVKILYQSKFKAKSAIH